MAYWNKQLNMAPNSSYMKKLKTVQAVVSEMDADGSQNASPYSKSV